MQIIYWSVTPENGTSPYVHAIVEGLRAAGWEIRHLSVLELMVSRNRVIHIQWPEHVSRGSTYTATVAKKLRALALLATVYIRQHKIVVTAHNRAPHSNSDVFDQWFRQKVYRRAHSVVVLVPAHAAELKATGYVRSAYVKAIPHPLTLLGSETAKRDATGALVVLGQIHPYHLVEEFMDALIDAGFERPVIVIGKVGDSELLHRLSKKAESHPWIKLLPGFASDAVLIEVLQSASAVVSLQKNTFNSGGPFVALPLGLPIVISKGAQADQLSSDLGPEWVFALPEQMSLGDLENFDHWLNLKRELPDLTRYSVPSIVDQHGELYKRVIALEKS